jgi:hypothetical protein
MAKPMPRGLRPALAGLQSLDGGVAALPERKIDPLHHEIMDFAALLEGGLAQRLIYSFGQIEARMDHIGPGPAPRGLPGRFCGRLQEGDSERILRVMHRSQQQGSMAM